MLRLPRRKVTIFSLTYSESLVFAFLGQRCSEGLRPVVVIVTGTSGGRDVLITAIADAVPVDHNALCMLPGHVKLQLSLLCVLYSRL